ncbi:MAG: DUF6377 domain-containing protein [Marinoscillum sp.]
MYKGLLVVVFLMVTSWFASAQSDLSTMSALEKLDEVLDKKQQFVAEREKTIQKVKMRLRANNGGSDELRFDLYNQLYQGYRSFIFDSAFVYAKSMIDLGYQMNDQSRIGYAKNQLGFILLSSGMFKETFDTLRTVMVRDLGDSTKIEHYALMARSLYDLCDYNNDDYYCDIYVDMADRFIDFGTNLSDPDSYNFLYLNGLKNLRLGNSDEAIKYLEKLLNGDVSLTNHQFAITTSTLSHLHLRLGDTTKAINLLAEASIADIKSATKETLALTRLAELLYRKGEIQSAYNYVQESMRDAEFYGAMQRKSEVGALLPIIAAARLNDIDNQRKTLLGYSIGLTVLSILTILFAISTFLQFRKLRKKDKVIRDKNDRLTESNDKLSEANKIKEEYLGYYFNINSEYIEKIEKFKRSVDQKLINKKYEDIRFVMSKIDLKKEREELYYSFDKVFLKLFPDFVQTFNSYFRPEDKIKLENDQLLNTELRIFALIRMGVSDSDKLAKILGYSVNTIYAYKNRIKSKAIIPNDEFERRIMEIEAI